jgi:hypothetical protein
MKKDNQSVWFAGPGYWFWIAAVLGVVVRIYLVLFTEGTTDVANWEKHARNVGTLGLIGYYHADRSANHPPFISVAESLFLRASEATGIPFRVLLRAPFALLDAGTAFLLLTLLPGSRWRFLLAAAHWLNPLAILLSSYHGNTDSAVAFFLLLSVWLLARQNIIGAAIVTGASLWIKLPSLLAIPALIFFVEGWRRRALFLGLAALAVFIGYMPAIVQDAPVIYENVFGYRGWILLTPAGVYVWGPMVLLFSLIAPPEKWPTSFQPPVLFFLNHSWQIAVLLSMFLVWLRRSRRSISELCATIATIYVIIYSFSNTWAFQYFAWSLPFWLFLPRWFFIPAILLAGGYIYSLYWVLCGDAALRGTWDFMGHPYWPAPVLWFRNAAVLFFFVAAILLLAAAVWQQIRPDNATSRSPADQGRP